MREVRVVVSEMVELSGSLPVSWLQAASAPLAATVPAATPRKVTSAYRLRGKRFRWLRSELGVAESIFHQALPCRSIGIV